ELELALRRPRTVTELEQTLRNAADDTAGLITLTDTLLAVGVQPDQRHSTTDVDLGALVTAHVHRRRVATARTDDGVHAAVGGDLAVRGDPVRLGLVVTNVLDNAVRHGAPPVTVTADRR